VAVRRSVSFAALVALTTTLFEPRVARAEAATTALELDVSAALVRRGALSVSDELSTRNGGVGVAVTALYRSRYFLAPFVDLAYYPLSASERAVDLGRGRELVTNRAWTFGFTGGVALDVWRVRLLAGLGAYDLRVQTWAAGERSTVSERDFGYMAGASVYPLVRERIRVGFQARVGLVVEAQTGFLCFGATLGGDAVTF
jgi:hypothetical protein